MGFCNILHANVVAIQCRPSGGSRRQKHRGAGAALDGLQTRGISVFVRRGEIASRSKPKL
jgi:hypothetical protein